MNVFSFICRVPHSLTPNIGVLLINIADGYSIEGIEKMKSDDLSQLNNLVN